VNPTVVNSIWRDVIYKASDSYHLEGTSDSQGKPGGGGTFGAAPAIGTAALPAGTWSHLAVTYDRTTLRLYVNGTQVASKAYTASIQTSANPVQIGGDSLYSQYFSGMIDEVRIYNVALTAAQIQADMNTPIATSLPPPPDTTPPTVSFSTPAAGATVSGSVTLSTVASDSGSGVAGIQYVVDGINVGAPVTGSPYSMAFDTTQLANGTHVIGVYGWDNQHNVSLVTTITVTISNATPGNPAQTGYWTGLLPWPFVSVHANYMHNGQLLMWDGQQFGHDARVWNPVTGIFTSVPTNDNLFCSGHIDLADGRVLVVGGHIDAHVGIPDANIFDPATGGWSAAAPMMFPRWYPSATQLSDGRIFVMSGETSCDECDEPTPEIYNPTTNSWTQLTNAQLVLPYYPHMYVLPDGRMLALATSEAPIATRVLNLSTQTWSVVDSHVVDGGTSVMYQPGKFLKAGKSVDPDDATVSSTSTAYVLDMTQATPAWSQVASMAFPRTYGTLTLLPDGTALMTGGGRTTGATDVGNGVLQAELWSPSTQTWRTLASMHAPRLYHSEAMLLPDGRVLVMGGGRLNTAEPTDQLSAEAFAPPYLFKGPRPQITSAPAQLTYGQAFTVTTPDAARIASVALIPTANVTHTINMSQRYLSLAFTAGSGTLSVTAPANGNLAPPGYYMLFIVDSNGVPAIASIVKF
jgi:hypothetical protein